MKLETQAKRLNKLSRAAGVGERCAYCRFALRETFESSRAKKAKPDTDKVLITCEWCGTQYRVTLPADPVARAVRLEVLHDTTAESYSTHRKRAVHIWLGYHARALAPKPKAKQATRRNDAQLTPAKKKRAEMIDALHKLLKKTHKRARRDAPKFPDLDELLIALQPGHYTSDEKSEYLRELYFKDRTKQLDALAKLETIIFGEPLIVTLETAAAVAEQMEAMKREKEEKAEQEKAERAERERVWQEQRQRTHAAVETPKPRADGDDFWTRELANRNAGDVPASPVGVPFEMPHDPTRGMILRSGDAPLAQQSPPRFRANQPSARPYRLNGTPKRSRSALVHVPGEK